MQTKHEGSKPITPYEGNINSIWSCGAAQDSVYWVLL